MKLDVTCMRYLTKDDFRVLVAVEMGMRNHELVPIELVASIAQLRHGGIYKIMSCLLRHKLVAHSNQQYNGYRLSYLGFDILALRTLLKQDVISSVGSQIGVGKESDIFEALDKDGNEVVIKIHRLGRTSFRSVRRNRDYMAGKSKASWLYMSRLAAIKEYAFMKALYAHEFPTPIPIAQNRHIVAMSRIAGFPMAQLKAGTTPHDSSERIFAYCMAMLRRLAEHGLIHCDFNEFNLMLSNEGEKVTLIDFPQMVSTSHYNATELFSRDVGCLVKFFAMKMRYIPPDEMILKLEDIDISPELHLDDAVRASGFSNQDDEVLMSYILENHNNDDDDDGGDGDDDDDVDSVDNNVEEEIAKMELRSDDVFTFHGSEGDAFVAEDKLIDNIKDSTSDTDDEEEEGVVLTAKKIKEVKDKVKRNMHRNGKKDTRNMTKKRNKYGKVDRAGKIDIHDGW